MSVGVVDLRFCEGIDIWTLLEMQSSNTEDYIELESQLYGQIQHKSSLEQTKPSEVYTEQRFPKARYWTQGQPCRGKKNINPVAGLSCRKNAKLAKTLNTKTELQPFKPYNSPLWLKSVDIPGASETKTIVHSVKKSKSGNAYGVLAGPSNIGKHVKPSNRNATKLAKVMKYQLKKMKASQSKEKQKNYESETITLYSSADESEVVEIPLPAPPTVTINSSEESDSDSALSPFVEPQIKHKISEKSSSRCVSPSSVISDDFIGHIDRSRLLEQKDAADDEDLIYLQESVGKFLYKRKSSSNCLPSRDNTQSGSFGTPKKCINIEEKPDYNVPDPNFRATDVYESESSDMPDCDQAAFCFHTKNSLDLDSQGETTADRTKKLTKRRTSSSVRESNENSSDDECDKVEGVQYISQGEAVEGCKITVQISKDGHSSDTEFLSLLKTVSQPITSRGISNDGDKSPSNNTEDISVRKIAGGVLNKSILISPKTSESKTTDDAITVNSEDIDELFDSIDKIQITNESVSNTEESETIEEEYAGDETNVHSIESKDNSDLHIIYADEKNLGWTEEMIRFYTCSWGQEKFNVRNIRKMMNVSSNWTIHSQDRFPKLKTYRNLKCHNCCEFGHIRAKCPHPRKELVCYMCGEKGHMEPRCPNTICLRCGHKTNFFTKCCNMCSHENKLICPICKIRGHSIGLCPDKWRRYHSTTEPNDYPNKKFECNENKYCCICAKQGHLSDNCKSALRFSEYPPAISVIKSYAKSYNDELIKFPFGHNMTGYSLLSRPCDRVLFKFSSKVTTKQYYGRFLNAVGLDYLMARDKRQKQLKHKNNEEVKGEPDCKIAKNNYVVNPFAKNIKKPKRHCKANLNSEEFEDIPKTIDEVVKGQKEIDQICKNVEVTFDERPQSKESTEESGIAYNTFSKDIINNHSTPYSKKKCRELEILPDFIPINSSEMEEYLDNNIVGISTNAQPDWKEDNSKENDDISCEAKLYLTKFQSTFLFSVEGNKFLNENCKKYNMKAKIEWTSVGYVLIIEGLPSAQDKFHDEFLNVIQKLSYKSKQQEVEKSQNVPKKREAVIKFLQHHLSQLEKNLGNVENLYKQLQAVQNQETKNAWKVAERIRRVLNMILIGQTGLKGGKANLQAIINKVKILKENVNMDVVPDNTRREIYEHWRCIFSSQQHENYDDLIQQYRDLKKARELPKLVISRRLLGEKVLDISLTDEQKQELNAESSLQTNVKIIAPNEDVSNSKNDVDLTKESFLHLQPSTKSSYIQGKGFKPRSFIAEQIQGVNNSWRHRCRNLINRLDEPYSRRWTPTHFREQANLKSPSIFWSRESMKFIDKCLAMNPSSLPIVSKLERVQEKAKQGLLSNNDYRAILQIHNALRGAFR